MSGRHPRKGEPGWRSRAGARPPGGWPSDRTPRIRERAPGGPRAKPKTKFERGRFVAWDGEAVDGRYVSLVASTGDELVRTEGITTDQALDFLIAVGRKHRSAIHVFFGGNYDFNQIVGDLARADAEDLWAGRFVRRGLFTIQMRPRKSLLVRRWDRARRRWDSVVLWDVIGFFQSSFLAALDAYFAPEEWAALDYDRIEHGKARRSQFTIDELASVLDYTRAEVRALVRLMERLHSYLVTAGLAITRWDGAGAVAAALLKREGVKNHLGDPPAVVQLAARHAYSGGRMELLRYGRHCGPVWRYDLNSAYPAAATGLPSLAGAEWEHGGPNGVICDLSLVRVRWQLAMRDRRSVECYPFFFRESYGDICYPPAGQGWCYGVEYLAAVDALRSGVYVGTIDLVESWTAHPVDLDEHPFSFLTDLYQQRRAWKEAGLGAEKVLKLGSNSVYGKLAQQVGYEVESGRTPPYQSMIYAGYITAATRATMLRAALRDLSAVVMFATDGLFVTAELGLPASADLGGWSVERCDGGIIVAQSGVYWTRTRLPAPLDFATVEHEYRRGFDPDSLSSDAVLAAWRRGAHELAACCDHPIGAHRNRWGNRPPGLVGDSQCVECGEQHAFRDGPRATRFVTLGSALADGEPTFARWRTWRTVARDLRLDVMHTKREEMAGVRVRPDLGLRPTRARVVAPDSEHLRLDADGVITFACPAGCAGSWPYVGGAGWVPGMVDGASEREFEAEVGDTDI